jgi:hypothetical protein
LAAEESISEKTSVGGVAMNGSSQSGAPAELASLGNDKSIYFDH